MHYCLSDMILDLLQNSVEAVAERIELKLWRRQKMLCFRLCDNGCGMTPEELAQAGDAFYSDGQKHPRRKFGLGLPFVIQTAQVAGGSFTINSKTGETEHGTELMASFDQGNIDTPPEGDWSAMFLQAMCFSGDYELIIDKTFAAVSQAQGYRLERSKLRAVLGDLGDSQNMLLLRDYLRSQEAA